MLKSLKTKAKKQTKGDDKKTKKTQKQKTKKDNNEDDDNQQDDTCANLVNLDQMKNDNKAKIIKKKDQPVFQQKDIEANLIIPQVKKQKKELTSWVVSVQDALNYGKEFNINDHDFQSLTNDDLNKKIQQKNAKQAAQSAEKVEIKQTAEGMKTTVIQKTAQQLKMEQDDGIFLRKKEQTNPIPFMNQKETNLNFVNSKPNNQTNFGVIEKSAQELKMEELQRKQQQMKNSQPKKQTWLGSNKQKQGEVSTGIVFRQTPLTFINTKKQEIQGNNTEIKFAPLNNNDGGIKFAPLQSNNKKEIPSNKKEQPPSRRRMDDDDGLVFLTKKQKQERRLKRQKQAQKILQSAK